MINFSIRELEVFVAVAEANSFSRAANELVLAQSTVSAHIKGLENALNVSLFSRDAKKQIILTEKGREIFSHAKAIVEQCQILSDEVSTDPARQELSIAASTDPFEYLLPDLMAEFMKQHSACRFFLANGDSTFVHEQLLGKNARLGFCGTAFNRKELRYRSICRDKLVMITPNNDYYQQMKAEGRMGCELLEEPMIVRGQNSGTKKEFDRYLEKNGMADRHLHIVARMNQAEAVKSSVIGGLGVAVISELAAKRYATNGDLLIFDLDQEGAYRSIYLVYPKDLVFSKAEREFIAFAVNHVKKKEQEE